MPVTLLSVVGRKFDAAGSESAAASHQAAIRRPCLAANDFLIAADIRHLLGLAPGMVPRHEYERSPGDPGRSARGRGSTGAWGHSLAMTWWRQTTLPAFPRVWRQCRLLGGTI
jgi:hypothetical protein